MDLVLMSLQPRHEGLSTLERASAFRIVALVWAKNTSSIVATLYAYSCLLGILQEIILLRQALESILKST